MKYLIIGAGGVGGPIGAYLARAGFDVTLIARGEHLRVMQENGLTIETAKDGTWNAAVKTFDMEHYDDTPDVVFVCVKGYSLEETVPFLQRICKKHTVVIPLLNIYGIGRRLQAALPENPVTDGCIYISANRKAPGIIFMHGTIFRVVYGMPDHRTDDPVLTQVRDDLLAAQIRPEYSDNIERDALKKFSYVSPAAGCGLYYGADAGPMQHPGKERDLFAQLMDEIETLAGAMGIHYEERLADINLRILDKLSPTASTSMQRDIAIGHASEIDGLIYEVVRMADKYGLDLPGYRMIAQEFRARGLQ